MQPRLTKILSEVFKVDPESITPESGPHTVEKWDSAGHMSLILALENEYGVVFNDDEVVELISVDAIAAALSRCGVDA